MATLILLLVAGTIAISAYMSIVFLASKVINNAGIVDVAWAFGFSLTCIFYLWLVQYEGTRGWVIALMVITWSLRLTWHLALRFKRWYPHEDPRYTELKAKLGSFVNAKMYLIFLWQGTMLTFMTAPIAVALCDARQDLGPPQMLAVFIWLLALTGETIADRQLSAFRANYANERNTCRNGLWRYSRHPNYFFEWLASLAFFLYASDSPFGLWTVLCPVVLLHLLINVTGIKPSEQHSLKVRSDYASYIRTTSPFIPWWVK